MDTRTTLSLITAHERTFAKQFMNCLEPLRKVHRTITLQLTYTFICVAYEEGLPITDYAVRCNVSPTTMTRHLKLLGSHGAGLKLIKLIPALLGDHRQRHVALTQKGEQLMREMIAPLRPNASQKAKVGLSVP
jgi:DNA-binding MarR family transcriptional regulator